MTEPAIDTAPPAVVEAPAIGADNMGLLERLQARLEAPEPAPAAAAPEPVAAAPEPAPAAVETQPEIEGELDDTTPADDLGLPLGDLDKPDADEADDAKTPEARAFKTLRTELKAEKTARTEVENRLKELEAKLAEREAAVPELTTLQEKLAEYEKTLAVAKLEATPAYKEAVDKPYAEIVQQSDTIAEKYEIDKYALTEAIAEPDRAKRSAKLKELLTGVDELDKLEVLGLSRRVEEVTAKQKELLENADKALLELEATQTEKEKAAIAARAKERAETIDKVIPHLAAKLPSFKADIEKLKPSLLDADPSSRPVSRQVYDAAAGDLLPVILRKLNQTQRDLEAALQSQQAEAAAEPGSGAGGATVVTKPDISAEDSFTDTIRKRLVGVA